MSEPKNQSLELCNDPEMAKILYVWGERNAWIEVQHVFHDKRDAKILDISKFLIAKAIEREILEQRLKICYATNLPYPYKENEFDYNYLIGPLEHFKKNEIINFLKSCISFIKI